LPKNKSLDKRAIVFKSNKRRFLKLGAGVWTTPLVHKVSLPAHAQASICYANDLHGRWLITANSTTRKMIFFDDGTTNDSGIWTLIGNNLQVNYSDGALAGQLLDGCKDMVGVIGNLSFVEIPFTGEKI